MTTYFLANHNFKNSSGLLLWCWCKLHKRVKIEFHNGPQINNRVDNVRSLLRRLWEGELGYLRKTSLDERMRGCLHRGPWSRLLPSKYVIVCWPCPRTTSAYIKKKKIVTIEFEVPKWPILKPTLSIVMVQCVLQWERQKRFSRCKCQGTMAEKLLLLSFLFSFSMIFLNFWPKKLKVMRKERIKKGSRSNMKKFPNLKILDIYLKNQHIDFLVHGLFSWSMFGLHLVNDPKTLKMHFFTNWTMEVWPW